MVISKNLSIYLDFRGFLVNSKPCLSFSNFNIIHVLAFIFLYLLFGLLSSSHTTQIGSRARQKWLMFLYTPILLIFLKGPPTILSKYQPYTLHLNHCYPLLSVGVIDMWLVSCGYNMEFFIDIHLILKFLENSIWSLYFFCIKTFIESFLVIVLYSKYNLVLKWIFFLQLSSCQIVNLVKIS